MKRLFFVSLFVVSGLLYSKNIASNDQGLTREKFNQKNLEIKDPNFTPEEKARQEVVNKSDNPKKLEKTVKIAFSVLFIAYCCITVATGYALWQYIQ